MPSVDQPIGELPVEQDHCQADTDQDDRTEGVGEVVQKGGADVEALLARR